VPMTPAETAAEAKPTDPLQVGTPSMLYELCCFTV
jgi:hypothetical protein